MEKRLVIFLLCSVLILTGHMFVTRMLAPPRPVAEKLAGDAQDQAEAPKGEGAEQPSAPGKLAQGVAEQSGDGTAKELPKKKDATPREEGGAEMAAAQSPAEPSVPQEWISVGSFAADSQHRLLIIFNNVGASIERVALVERESNGKLRYRDLDEKYGYLGLECRDTPDGCVVRVVGAGTPAALAKPTDGTVSVGLSTGDIIETVDDAPINSCLDFESWLAATEPAQNVKIRVRRTSGPAPASIDFSVALDHRPLELIQPDQDLGVIPVPSYLLGLYRLGKNQTPRDAAELPEYASLRNGTWTVEKPNEDEVVFRKRIKCGSGADAGELEFVKRFRLGHSTADPNGNVGFEAYHLAMSVEIVNHATSEQTVAYGMDGPNGLPKEGWWYSNKIHPAWGSAGARDVIWRVTDNRHSLRSATQIYKQAKDESASVVTSILTDNPSEAERTLDYLGVDTQYFSVVLMAGSLETPRPFQCEQAFAMPVGEVPKLESRAIRTLNTTYRFNSLPHTIPPGESVTDEYHLFLGPKSPPVLAAYGLSDIIEYGWFGWIAKPLSKVLHFFYAIIRNYGLAIILLTVLVRGAMFPIGRKAARNAQVMQELAPEIKKIKEKYKNDLEKQGQAQRELWKKHNFNPLGGCWLMFLQLPIFIGLYRCLSVDIELRQASLIPGLHWCSNLAGPDMAWYWKGSLPNFLAGETGWLGPYLNVLPIITIILFIAQQKMFTPPATDDQTKMQQKMMKYMMIFMGVLFFKVPAGLCLYFIASSVWGIAERKLLPKPGSGGSKFGGEAGPQGPEKRSLLQRLTEKVAPDPAEVARARRKQRRR